MKPPPLKAVVAVVVVARPLPLLPPLQQLRQQPQALNLPPLPHQPR